MATDFRGSSTTVLCVRSVSITFDICNCQDLFSALQTGMDDAHFEQKQSIEWYELAQLLGRLDLELLEVSFKNYYCAFCHSRMVTDAMIFMLNGIRVVFNEMVNDQEVVDARRRIDGKSIAILGRITDLLPFGMLNMTRKVQMISRSLHFE